ncbi:unnamed protein product [Timema podura]|uniref:Uncharacterized protein n=1 Tax=Timema podura TaxID=61482 RepID=A0ABN7NM47_TIMPD|nr:unnamed protein product [Timema podura]
MTSPLPYFFSLTRTNCLTCRPSIETQPTSPHWSHFPVLERIVYLEYTSSHPSSLSLQQNKGQDYLPINNDELPVPVPHCRVIVNHASSNKNLSVEPCHWFPSYFGMECQVSVHTYRDVHRRETSENMWMFITQKPTDPQLVKPSD